MKNKKAVTLVELLVVVVVVTVMVVLVLHITSRRTSRQGMTKRAICGSNLKNIGTGIKMYQAENDDLTPWIDGCSGSVTTGTNATDTGTPTSVSPTALMFLLVRTKQMSADMLRCPSDDNSAKMNSIRFTDTSGNNYYYWDFYDNTKGATTADHCKRVSYSYQAPLYDQTDKSYRSGDAVDAVSGGGLAVMADKTPDFDGETPCTDWSGDLSEKQRQAGMSQNHESGDFINVLYFDAHVKGCKRADVGIAEDNIYSASNDADEGTQGAGTTTLTHHLCEDDSFLIGPIK